MNSSKKKHIFMVIVVLSLLVVFPLKSEAKTSKYNAKKIASEKHDNRWGIKKISQKDVEILAKIVYLESGNQGDKGEQAVIETIFNRVAHKRFPNTIRKVLSQKNQFSTWRRLGRGKMRTQELRNIYKVLSGDTNILSKKVVYFSVGPMNRKVELHYKNHYFCRY